MKKIPTITELYEKNLAKFEVGLGVNIPEEGKNYLRTIAAAISGEEHLMYLAIGMVQKNSWIDTADPVAQGGTGERYGVVKMGRYPFPASQGVYTATVTGQPGSVIKAGTTFKSDDTTQNPGYQFQLDIEYTMPGSTGTILLRALTAGTVSQLYVGDTLTATQPLNDVDATATIDTVSSEPLDEEDFEDYRAATIRSFRTETQGGADGDYIVWAQDAQGVAAVYPYTPSGEPWTVRVFVEATVTGSTPKGLPTAGILADVEEVINTSPDTTLPITQRRRRPMQVVLDVVAVVILDVVVTVNGLVATTTDKQTLLTTAIKEVVNEVRPFIAGAEIIENRNDTLSINKIVTAIQNTIPGQEFTSVTMTVDGNAETSYVFNNGEIPWALNVVFA